MKNHRLTLAVSIAIALLAGIWGIQSSSAQTPPAAPAAPGAAPTFKRVELQRHDVGTTGREAVTARAEFQAGGMAPKHTHPGEEFGYVLEGELVLELEGKAPMKLKAGDSFFIPAGGVHSAKNPGKTGSAVLSTYVIEKGKPLASPVK